MAFCDMLAQKEFLVLHNIFSDHTVV